MPRTAIHHESRKRELVAVAEQVFIRLGYAETTVSDLLAATGRVLAALEALPDQGTPPPPSDSPQPGP